MLDPEVSKLQAEQSKGEEYGRIFDSYIKPFLEAKREVLFDAFQQVSVADVDALKDIKLQLTAINSLEAHFNEFITTGKLAAHKLEN